MRTRYLVAGAVVAGALSTGFGFQASASTPAASSKATGSFNFQSDYTSAAVNGISSEISQLTYSGTLVGIAIDKGTENTYANGSFTGSGTEYCAACKIGGYSGAFIATYIYWGSGNTYSGAETFTQGFGKLAGLVGGGSFKGNVQTNTNSYQYTYSLP